MTIDIREQTDLVFFTDDSSKPDNHIFMYKLTPLQELLGERKAEDLYIAVPNGKKLTLKDLPGGRYELKQLTPMDRQKGRGERDERKGEEVSAFSSSDILSCSSDLFDPVITGAVDQSAF